MYIIDIEGTDGSGKATQTKLLFDYLVETGYRCKILSFPNYDSLSSGPVKMYLAGELGENEDISGYQASVLFAADRLATIKKEKLTDFDFVLMDRYTYSNMIHQSTRFKTKIELDRFLDWVSEFEFGLLSLPKPDLTLFLDVPAEISFELAKGRDRLKNQQTKDILEQNFSHIKLAHDRAEYVAKKFNWETIDCTKNHEIKSIDEIHNEIIERLKSILNKNFGF